MSEFIDIGPECFAAADGSVLSWRGRNYVPQAEAAGRDSSRDGLIVTAIMPTLEEEHVDTLLGFDVNDFRSRVVYAIFNDPEGDDMKALPEALKPQLLDVPLMEDESPRRIRDHARLMNEDRARHAPERSRVVVKTQTLLRTPWVIVAEADND